MYKGGVGYRKQRIDKEKMIKRKELFIGSWLKFRFGMDKRPSYVILWSLGNYSHVYMVMFIKKNVIW